VTDEADVRCPRCQALVRPGSPWCTLCYTDLRPAPLPDPIPEPEPGDAAPVFDPLTAPLELVEAVASGGVQPRLIMAAASEPFASTFVGPELAAAAVALDGVPTGWPCSKCETVVPFEETSCPTCGTRFLAGSAGEPDFVERITRSGVSKSMQAAIIGGGALLIIIAVLALMYVLSLVL
jgi:hypothetical protein